MPPGGSRESGRLPEETPEEQSLMASANPGEGEDAPAPDAKVKNLQGGGGGGALLQMGLEYSCDLFLFFFTC